MLAGPVTGGASAEAPFVFIMRLKSRRISTFIARGLRGTPLTSGILMSKFHAGWDSDAKRRCLPCRGMFLFDCVLFLLGMLFLRNENRNL